jgi:hypothetical protein
VAPAQRSPAAEARAHKQNSQAVAKKLKLKMIFKKVQEGCKIRRTYGIFGYDRPDKLFYFRWRWSFSPAFEAAFSWRADHQRSCPNESRRRKFRVRLPVVQNMLLNRTTLGQNLY